jgi:hypothetical protein
MREAGGGGGGGTLTQCQLCVDQTWCVADKDSLGTYFTVVKGKLSQIISWN